MLAQKTTLLALAGFMIATQAVAEIPKNVSVKAAEVLNARCGNLVDQAESVALVSNYQEVEEMDQGVRDTIYTLVYRFEADSLPPRYVRLVIVEASVSNPSIEKIALRQIFSNGFCN